MVLNIKQACLIILPFCLFNVMANEPSPAVTDLDEIVVTANQDLFKIKGANHFVYEVYKDSSLKDADALKALSKIPVLKTSKLGNVSSMDGKKLVFKINGLSDPLLYNLQQALTAIGANTIKSIELKNDNAGDGEEIIVVNIVTKGRLEGYRIQLTSQISDSKWRNGVWGMSKIRNLNISGSYFNTWQWGHSSSSGQEEFRYDTPETYRFVSNGKSSGYKVDLHNIEINASYDIDDRSFLNIFGGVMLKSNPRSFSSYTQDIFSSKGANAISYRNSDKTYNKDSEYSASIKYERRLGSDLLPGHLYIGYQYYDRPFHSLEENNYDLINNTLGDSIKFLNLTNSSLTVQKTYRTHTANVEWQKQTSKNLMVSLYGKFRTRHESYDNNFEFTPVSQTQSIVTNLESFKTSLVEMTGDLTPKIAYFTDKWEIRGGFVTRAYRQKIKTSDNIQTHNNTKITFLPFISTAYLTNRKLLMELFYNMNSATPDISALDPYMDRTIAGEVKYGNPRLNPQLSHSIRFNVSKKTGKLRTAVDLKASYSKDIILSYKFVSDGILNKTFGNIANGRSLGISGYTSGRLSNNTYLRVNAGLDWIQYRSPLLELENHGWEGRISASLEQELPFDITLDASASYSSKSVNMQGKGPSNFSYDISLYRQFFNKKLTVILDADSFIPIWYKRDYSSFANGYSSTSWNKDFHAYFSLTLRYSFGKLKASVKDSSFEIENNDIKQDYSK